MLVVETYLAESSGKGLGIFSKHNLSKGTVIWKFRENLDIKVHKDELLNLSDVEKNFIEKYFWTEGNYYYSCCDHAMFQNHSFDPNCTNLDENTVVTIKDVKAGEELTANYKSFDDSFDEYKNKLI